MSAGKIDRIKQATHVYLGFAKCGCCVAAYTDCGDRDTAAGVADFIRTGLTVQRISFEEYRASDKYKPLGCQCKPAQKGLWS